MYGITISGPVFECCIQRQMMILHLSLDELIKPGHPVRVDDEVLDKAYAPLF